MSYAGQGPLEVRGDIVRMIARIKCLPELETDPGRDWSFPDLGFDSLDLVELAGYLARDYGIELGAEPEDFAALGSVSSLAGLVARRRKA